MKKFLQSIVSLTLAALMLVSPLTAFAATDTSTFESVPYEQTATLEAGQRVTITGTPNYSAATNNASSNFFGFDTSEGVWYIAIGKTTVEEFKAAAPAQQMTLYGMYAGKLDANGMPILDIQQGAVLLNKTVNESGDLFAAGKKAVEAQQAEAAAKAASQAESKPQGQMVWIPRTGKRYHRSASCSNMKDPSYVTLEQAEKLGYTPCKKCY